MRGVKPASRLNLCRGQQLCHLLPNRGTCFRTLQAEVCLWPRRRPVPLRQSSLPRCAARARSFLVMMPTAALVRSMTHRWRRDRATKISCTRVAGVKRRTARTARHSARV